MGWSAKEEITNELYGSSYSANYGPGFRFMRYFPVLVVFIWLVGSGVFAAILTRKGTYDDKD